MEINTESSSQVIDRVAPSPKWEFDKSVAACFDNMLERSIPQYRAMRRAVRDLALEFTRPGSYVIDLGCSRGRQLHMIAERTDSTVSLLGVDVSQPMVEAARLQLLPWATRTEIINLDLRQSFPSRPASVVLSVLTLQFTPIEYRQRIVSRAFQCIEPGGALILVEKILGSTAFLDETMVARYYDFKTENGYSQEDIDRKRLSLEGVLVPITAEWNEHLLKSAGFKHVDCFWRWMNFAGWLAIKD